MKGHADPAHVYVGRDRANADWFVDDGRVSSLHCRFGFDSQRNVIWLEDLNSSNGTWADEQKLEPHQRIDVMAFGPQGERLLVNRVRLGSSVMFAIRKALFAKLYAKTTQPAPLALLDRVGTLPPPEPDPKSKPMGTVIGETGPVPVVMRDDGAPEQGSPSITIGSSLRDDIVISSPFVSRRHARLYLEPSRGTVVVEDLGSSNGLYYGGERVSRVRLRSNDTFSLHRYDVTLDAYILGLLQHRADDIRTGRFATLPPGLPSEVTVGSHPGNAIVIDGPGVQPYHAVLRPDPANNGYIVEPVSAGHPPAVEAPDNFVRRPMFCSVGEVLFLGQKRLPLRTVVDRLRSALQQDDAIPLPSGLTSFVVGRGDAAHPVDVRVTKPQVSKQHARVDVVDGGFRITDLGSANGTTVGGAPIVPNQVYSFDSVIGLGSFTFRFVPQHVAVAHTYVGDIALTATGMSVRKRKQFWKPWFTILQDVSFSVYPGEFVGLMGPSGAGKTTLLTAILGIDPAFEGAATLNNRDVRKHYDEFRGNVGYVPQDDIVFPQLTVYESLYYTARLRLPNLDRAQIDQRIRTLLDSLDILDRADARIGDAVNKGISGGQRKRVNLAQELITDPALLLLDEPTSGLASEDTINVMNLLRGLADEGRTIILTIHQPSLEAYKEMDNVLYLVRGRLVYYGPTHPDSIEFFHPNISSPLERDQLLSDPGNALKPIADDVRRTMETQGIDDKAKAEHIVAESLNQRYRAHAHHETYVARRADPTSGDLEIHAGSKQRVRRRGMLRQLLILTSRNLKVKLRDSIALGLQVAQAPLVMLCLLAFAGEFGEFIELQREPIALFLMVASAIWFGCNNSAREIVAETAIYRRERMVNLMIPSYVSSKLVVMSVICLVQCGLLLVPLYFLLGLQGSLPKMFGVLWLVSLVGIGWGLLFSAMVKTAQAAVSLVPMLLIPQIVLGGAMLPLVDLPKPLEMLSNATATRWGFEALSILEYQDVREPDIESLEEKDRNWDSVAAMIARCNEIEGTLDDEDEEWTCYPVEAVPDGTVAATESETSAAEDEEAESLADTDEDVEDDDAEDEEGDGADAAGADLVPMTRVPARCVDDSGVYQRDYGCCEGMSEGSSCIGIVPELTATEDPFCAGLCAQLGAGYAITPIDRSFGVNPKDPHRTLVGAQEGAPAHESARSEERTIPLGVLAAQLLLLLLGTMISLKRKDLV